VSRGGFLLGLQHDKALGRQMQRISLHGGGSDGEEGDIGSVQLTGLLTAAGVHGDQQTPSLVGKQAAAGSIDGKRAVVPARRDAGQSAA